MINRKLLARLFESAGFPADAVIEQLPGAGSDRQFARVYDGSHTAILMFGTGHGAALDDWLAIQLYLSSLGFGVPRVYASNSSIPALVVEDIGEMRPPKLSEYPLIVRELARLAVIGSKEIGKCRVVADRPFDSDAFRWESQYFSERYLLEYKGISQNKIEKFTVEFDALAERLAGLTKAFCHRDFQSSNIAVRDSKVRIIDFQSAKLGPPEYDLASLLWDSRVDIQEDTRNELIGEYIDAMRELDYPVDAGEFKENVQFAAISRMMQALGAYCFLSNVKGKRKFITLIKPAEIRLRELLNKLDYISGLTDYI